MSVALRGTKFKVKRERDCLYNDVKGSFTIWYLKSSNRFFHLEMCEHFQFLHLAVVMRAFS